MKNLLVCMLFNSLVVLSFAQKNDDKDVFAFTITNYMQSPNDSITIVQIQMPDGFKIDEKQMGLLKRNYSNNKEDTARIGYGRCNLIKGDYYYFGLKLDNKINKPQPNDLIYTWLKYDAKQKGIIYGLTKNAIYLSNIYDSIFYNFSSALWMNEQSEKALLSGLANDIKFTGKAMLEQMPQQNQVIKGGIFNGKKLFEAMQLTTTEDVVKFLKYINVRPRNYAGNTWKISEIFATWITSESPTVIE
jgi:hypothetical protein